MKCSIALSVLAAAGFAAAQWDHEHEHGWEHHSEGDWDHHSKGDWEHHSKGDWEHHSKGEWGHSKSWAPTPAPVATGGWYPAKNSSTPWQPTATQAPPASSYVPPPATGAAQTAGVGLAGALLAGIAAFAL